jgi:aminoglycoside phosphotransferase family enzyme/predicted kinase
MNNWKSLVFNHPVNSIRFIETHISTVVLTGMYAYKIKKNVDFGFIDFSTLEKRKFFCFEELRLNQRFAPEIYLEVVSIDESFQINGKAKIIDYAVKMLEFPQECLLSYYIEKQLFTDNLCDLLADEISDFHQKISISSKDEFGSPHSIEKSFLDNFPYFSNTLFSEVVDSIFNWSIDKFQNIKEVLLERKNSGFIRECHGDLHMGNIAIVNHVPVLFDCIEFSEKLRWIDVMSDLAFLLMDMEERNLKSFAYRLLNRYMEKTGDFKGLKLLRFYQSYRSMVRAKVSILQNKDPSPYMNYAKFLTAETQPEIFITYGLSGSGKSFTTSRLLEEIPAIRIRSDIERKRIHGNSLYVVNPENLYNSENIDDVYKHLLSLTEIIISSGYSVIVDATFLKEIHRSAQRDLAEKLKVKFTILEFECPLPILEERIRKRIIEKNDPSEADIEVLYKQIQNREKLSEREKYLSIKSFPIS